MQARNSLARFKKRKSKPTVGSGNKNDGKKADRPDVSPPPTESPRPDDAPTVRPPPYIPPSNNDNYDDRPISEAEKSEKDRKLNLLFWMRIIVAVSAGAAATFVFNDIEGEERRWASIGFMIILFIGTVIVAKSMKMQLPSSDRKKIVTQALGSYVFLYLFTWIVTYTLVNLENVEGGINL